MDVHLRRLLSQQDSVVAWRQLRALGISVGWARGLVREWTEMHNGVWLASYGEPTRQQRWRAATLTTPRSVLSHFSAAAYHGIREHRGAFDAVTRPGCRGPQQIGLLRIHYSQTLGGNATNPHGYWVTTPERTIIDNWPNLKERAQRKLVREALRQRKTSTAALLQTLADSKGRRGTPALNALVSRYQRLGLERCRSDAEAFAMEVLDDAGIELPQVNALVAGREADLSWPGYIIEIDGPGYHVLTDEDAHKTATWEQAGNTVRRISSDALFAEPALLVRLATLRSIDRA